MSSKKQIRFKPANAKATAGRQTETRLRQDCAGQVGEIPQDWKVDTLENLSQKIISGGTPSRENRFYYENGTISWVKTQELQDNNIYDTEEKISEEALDDSAARVMPAGTVSVAMYGATVGKLGVLGIEAATNQACCNLATNPSLLNNRFLFYTLLNRRMELIGMASGAAQQNLNVGLIKNLKIATPPLTEQKQIASILSSLDDKIELNRKMNKTLEEIGRAIFKHWFIDFEFPNNEGKPYKSSGGEMVGNEVGEIPKGWRVGRIGEFGKVICGKTPPKSKKEYFGGKIPFIKIPDMHGKVFIVSAQDSLSEKGKQYQSQKSIPKNSICVSCIATVGLICISSKESQTNQQINSIVPQREFYLQYLYYLLGSMNKLLKDYASGGSATLNLNTRAFSNIKVVLPSYTVLKMFSETLAPLFEQILNNDLENRSLSQARDSLLPRLMSGRLRIKDSSSYDEIACVKRFLEKHHRLHNIKEEDRYVCYKNPKQEMIDVFCHSKSGKLPILEIEVTTSEAEAFSEVRKMSSYLRKNKISPKGRILFERDEKGCNKFCNRWKTAIFEKYTKYVHRQKKDIKNLVLLLDGWPVVYKNDLEKFKKKEKKFLESLGFKEIWFVGRTQDLVVKLC